MCFRCQVAIYLSSLVELETEIPSEQEEKHFKTEKVVVEHLVRMK